MYSFSKSSEKRLKELQIDLQSILTEAIEIVDFAVLTGYRDEETQNKAYQNGFSKLKFPQSKHNSEPSKAVDIAPSPVDYKDTKRFYYLAGIIKAIAHKRNIPIRWGGDWDNDNDFTDNKFNDLVHFELF